MSDPSSSSYVRLLRRSGAGSAFAAATFTRLSYATVSLALLLGVQAATDSFAIAGAVLGAYGLAGVTKPLLARLVDRYGRRRILTPLGAGYALSLLAIAACVSTEVRSGALYIALGVISGLFAPPVGPVMRAIWASVTPTQEDRQRAYSLDAVSEEAMFALGPLLVGLLIVVGGPVAALVATALIAGAGSIALARLTPVGLGGALTSPGRPRQGWWGPFSSRGFVWVALVMLAVGLGMTPLEVAVAARATETGSPAAAGYLLATLSVASAGGGLIWGRIEHTRSLATQLLVLMPVLALGTIAAGTVTSVLGLLAALAVTGLAVAPVFVVAYLAADELVPAHARTEASTWLNTVHNFGGAAGATAAGIIIDRYSAQAAFLLGGAVLAVTTLVIALRRHRMNGS